MKASGWYGRPVAAACAILAALAASGYILSGAEFGPRESAANAAFAVTIRHYGIDAREMERSVAVPLEDALAALTGALETSSTSEYGKARVLVRFAPGTDTDASYEAVSDAAQRVYAGLPSSAQRPEIGSTSEGQGPAWIAAVSSDRYSSRDLARILERSVKPSLEKIPDAGEVELAGTGLPEIVVELDQAEAAALGIGASSVARSLAYNDLLAPAGSVREDGGLLTIVVDGRYASAEALGDALVPSGSGRPVRLGSFARVLERDRRPDALSRVDGQPAITIAVHPGGGANLPALSKALTEGTKAIEAEYGIEFHVLYDAGARVSESFNNTLSAMIQGALSVALASALLVGRGRRLDAASIGMARRARVVAVVMVPVILVLSGAVLAAFGYGLDRHVLAGLAAGLGTSVDAGLLAAERLGAARSAAEGRASMRTLIPSLTSGTATTVVVLIPLARLDFLSEGVSSVAAAIAVVNVVAYIATVVFMPPLILGGKIRSPRQSPRRIGECRFITALGAGLRRVSRRLVRFARRALARNAALCARRPLAPLLAALAVSAAGLAAILLSPLDTGGGEDGDSVYAHVEFEPGASVESVDERLSDYAAALAGAEGVLSVQSTARRGSGSVTATFDPARTDYDRVSDEARSTSVPGGFVWIPQPSAQERSWELVVSGDDDAECQRVAARTASAVSELPFVLDTVLNFKEGPEDVALRPDRERAAALGVSFAASADALRRGVHGPVAYKRIGPEGETDVRVTVANRGLPEPRDASAMLVPAGEGSVRVDSFMTMSRERDASRIYRRDRRRVASITMRTTPIDPRTAKTAVLSTLESVPRPSGYGIEFDRAAIESAQKLSGAGLSFLLAAALAYMAIAIITESFGAPLAVMSALPPSLALPAILLALSGTPMNASVACAFVAVSGLVVNASVLTVDERRARRGADRLGGARSEAPPDALELYRITRARIASLAATSGTSVAGAIPFLFLSDAGGAMARTLAFVTAIGTTASFFAALTVVPALARMSPRLFDSFYLSEVASGKGVVV